MHVQPADSDAGTNSKLSRLVREPFAKFTLRQSEISAQFSTKGKAVLRGEHFSNRPCPKNFRFCGSAGRANLAREHHAACF